MPHSERIKALNTHRPPFIALLDGHVCEIDDAAQSCTFEFHPGTDVCHSVDVVQGGFITVMLDAAMSHAVFAHLGPEGVVALSSLEVTTRYHAITRGGQGPVFACGWIRQATFKTAFLESELLDADGADSTLRDGAGLTAAEVAQQAAHLDVVRVFAEHAAKELKHARQLARGGS